ALISGICSKNSNVIPTGILPTPGIAYLTAALGGCAGIVVSASHNPYTDNGIKVFDADGYKLSVEQEEKLENLIQSDAQPAGSSDSAETGTIRPAMNGTERYLGFLSQTLPDDVRLQSLKVVLDCANGATFLGAPILFSELGATLQAHFASPNGRNINDGCGSQHPQALAEAVKTASADVGLAFDGDGDRLVAVDETGAVLTGDQVLAICARHMKNRGNLKNNTVVSTVMSNMGLAVALQEMEISHVVTDVGDRHVTEEMRSRGAVLGGENSGHTVFLDHQTTGDGMLTGLKLLEVMVAEEKPLSELKRVMTVFPQVLINVDVGSRPRLEGIPEVREMIQDAEKSLKGKGRVLVRYSGTQPQCRVMVEGPTEKDTRQYCEQIAGVIRKNIGI
ncbi:MAG: phosphoglucosamine mutase, partial [Deltaproteobacteria bacterium SG8_13]